MTEQAEVVTAADGSVPWEWLASCTACGKPHAYRPETCGCGKERVPGNCWTWKDPVDGHSYHSRISPTTLKALMDQYRAECSDSAKGRKP